MQKKKNSLLDREMRFRGFTLVELMVSVFIFLMIMTATVTIFTREITAYRVARETQKNIENAQFTLNFIAKVLRTSQVNTLSTTEIYAYDHSQAKCFIFTFEDDALKMQRQTDGTDLMTATACSKDNDSFPSGDMDLSVPLTIGEVQGTFHGKKSSDGLEYDRVSTAGVGAVTTSLVIEPQGGARSNVGNVEKVFIQTTSSLRDYSQAGLTI